jgi:hypothetical protein
MKGKNAILNILSSYPELADEWIADENHMKAIGKSYQYFKDISIENLRNIAQNNLFSSHNLEDIKPAFDCACTS